MPSARHEATGGRRQPWGAAASGAAAVMGSGSAASRLPCGASARARPAGTARKEPGAGECTRAAPRPFPSRLSLLCSPPLVF